mgnify:CR=1 FL=1
MDRLHRITLLLGKESVKKLQKSTVMVVGCGAVGSFAIEALARSGVGHIILVDFDKVEESNINRQLFALDSTIDKPKVLVASQRIADINPKIKIEVFDMFFDENTNVDVKPDFVIDAIDTVSSKIALYKWCENNNIPFVSSMGAARKTDLTKIKIWDDIIAASNELNIDSSAISKCCNHVAYYKTAGNFVWYYLHDNIKIDGTIIPGAISLGLITQEEANKQLNDTKLLDGLV